MLSVGVLSVRGAKCQRCLVLEVLTALLHAERTTPAGGTLHSERTAGAVRDRMASLQSGLSCDTCKPPNPLRMPRLVAPVSLSGQFWSGGLMPLAKG